MKNNLICFLFAAVATAAPVIQTQAATDELPSGSEVRIIPMIRSGVEGDWEFRTSLLLQNTSDRPIDFEIVFFDEAGRERELTFVVKDQKSKSSRVRARLAPHQASSYLASSAPEKVDYYRWARIRSSVQGALSVESLNWYKKQQGDERYFSLHSLSGNVQQSSFIVIGSEDLAMVNDSESAQTVHLVARGEDGKELCQADRVLKPGQMLVDAPKKVLPCTEKSAGTVVITAPNGVAAIMMRYMNGIHIQYPSGSQESASPATSQISVIEDRLKEVLGSLMKSTGGKF